MFVNIGEAPGSVCKRLQVTYITGTAFLILKVAVYIFRMRDIGGFYFGESKKRVVIWGRVERKTLVLVQLFSNSFPQTR